MNLTILFGNVTHEPLLKYLTINDKSVAVCNFSIAIHRHFKKANGEKQKETTFIDCEAWDSGAETISKYVSKGDKFLVRGSLKNDSWERPDGQKVTKTKLRVEDFELPSRPRLTETTPINDTSDVTDIPDTPAESKDGDDIPF